MKTCNQDCNQGRTCDCDDQPVYDFDYIAEIFRDLFALIGFVLMLALIAFVWGYNV
jgi:hypothetical protein